MSSTKLELKTCILLEISLGMTTLLGVTILKISLSNNLQTILCPDTDSKAFKYLFVNLTSLSDITLTWPGYITSWPWSCSARGKGANSINRSTCIVVAGIWGACIRDAYIDSTCAIGTWITFASDGSTCTSIIYAKSISIRDIKLSIRPRALLTLGVILAGLGINDCCLVLLINLIFVSINIISCCSIVSWAISMAYICLK